MPRRTIYRPKANETPNPRAQEQRAAAQALDDDLLRRMGGEPSPAQWIGPENPLEQAATARERPAPAQAPAPMEQGVITKRVQELRNQTQREALWTKPLPDDARPIPSFPGYGITRDGRVFHGASQRAIRKTSSGRPQVQIETPNGRTSRLIATLLEEVWGGGDGSGGGGGDGRASGGGDGDR